MINCNVMIDRGMKVINFPIILNVGSSGSKKNIPKNIRSLAEYQFCAYCNTNQGQGKNHQKEESMNRLEET